MTEQSKDTNQERVDEEQRSKPAGKAASKLKKFGTWAIFIVIFVVVLLVATWVTLSRSYREYQRQDANRNEQNAGVKSALEAAKGVGGEQDEAALKVGAGRDGYEKSGNQSGKQAGGQVPAIPVTSTSSASATSAGDGSPVPSPMDAALTFDGGGKGTGNGIYDGGGGNSNARIAAPAPTAGKKYDLDFSKLPGMQGLLGNDKPSNDGLNLGSLETPGVRAKLLGNRNWILAKGEMIDCALNTALRSTVPGMSSCTVTKDIYSDNGKIVLIERGTIATGEYRATIKPGQSRISVLWNRLRTPRGVVIDLDSPGADSLGRSGLDGEIDNHWGQRLGAAFLLSFVQDAIAYAATVNAPAGSSGTSYYQNSQNTGSEMANTILKETIGIAPTLDRDQGTRLSIFVARDLDFSPVYKLQLRGAGQ